MVTPAAPTGKWDDLPKGSVILTQIQYAWLWSSMPLLVILLAVLLYDPATFSILFAVMSVMILVPKFFQWRKTAYVLTPNEMIYQRGGILSTRRYQIPMTRFKQVKSRPGLFGKYLGYQHVEVHLDSGARASLMYLPASLDVEGHFMDLVAKAKERAEKGEAPVAPPPADAPQSALTLPPPVAAPDPVKPADHGGASNGSAPDHTPENGKREK